jgi:hypothetical protein
MWYGRNQDGTLVKFQYKPWMDTSKWKWCNTNDDGTNDYGEVVEETDKTKDIKFEDDAVKLD